jgi:hypothetical protein
MAACRSPKPLVGVQVPAGTPVYFSAIGEMDIITVFETVGGGSIPSWPARFIPRSSNGRALLLHGSDGGSIPSRGTKPTELVWSFSNGLKNRGTRFDS